MKRAAFFHVEAGMAEKTTGFFMFAL